MYYLTKNMVDSFLCNITYNTHCITIAIILILVFLIVSDVV